MNRKLSESDAVQLERWIEKRNYAKIDKWIEQVPEESQERAKRVFLGYRSLKALETVEAVIHPPILEVQEVTGDNSAVSKLAEVKRVVISCLERGLEILSGEEYHHSPELGFSRSPKEKDALEFGKFRIAHSSLSQGNENGEDVLQYELKLGKCDQVKVEIVDRGVREIYEGKKIRGFALVLEPGKYRVTLDGEDWEIELR